MSQHKVLKYFYNLSLEAIELAVRQKMNKKLWNFAVEIQWRMCKYRLGTADAASQFRIDLGDITDRGRTMYKDDKSVAEYDVIGSVLKSSEIEHKTKEDLKDVISADDSAEEKERKLLKRIFFKVEFESEFVTLYLDSYRERVAKDNEEFMTSSKNQALYLRDLFDVLGRNWTKNQILLSFLDELYSDFADMDLDFVDEDDDAEHKLLLGVLCIIY